MSLSRLLSRLAGFGRNERGATAVIVALTGVVLIGFVGMVVDIGRVMVVQRQLQAATDAAALAGAYNIEAGTAVATATAYSSTAGQKNAAPDYTATMLSGFPKLKCLTSIAVTCVGSTAANAITVKQQAVVPMYFAQIFGTSSMTVTSSATASAKGGTGQALDVMVVVDTTASMNDTDSSCSIAGATRLQCALAGMTALLSGLDPSLDHVGMMVFPGLTSSSYLPNELNCTSIPGSAISKYSGTPIYQIVALGNDFKSSSSSKTLSTTSNIVQASAPGSGCATNVKAVGGMGTFYADVINSAQNALATDGRSSTQKVIVFLSDGDANASTGNMPSGEAVNQCHEAITAAQNAAKAGTWVYSIGYGASTSATPGSCSTDTTAISACTTMQDIASDSTKFFSDNSGGSGTCTSANSYSDLVSLFSGISSSLQQPRLIPDNTT